MIIQQSACKTKLSVSFAFKEAHSWYVHKIVAWGKQYTETTIVLPSPLSCLHIYSCLIYADRKKQNMQIRAGTSIKQCIDILLPNPDTCTHTTQLSVFTAIVIHLSPSSSPQDEGTAGWWPKNNRRSLQLSSAESSGSEVTCSITLKNASR